MEADDYNQEQSEEQNQYVSTQKNTCILSLFLNPFLLIKSEEKETKIKKNRNGIYI